MYLRGVMKNIEVEPPQNPVSVRELLASDSIAAIVRDCVVGARDERLVTHPRVQKSGLVLVGHRVGVVPTRVQVFGETEISFLESLGEDQRRERAEGLCEMGISLVVVTRGVEPPKELVVAAESTGTPMVVSSERSSRTIRVFHQEMDRLLAPKTRVHGVLIEVHGLGTLLRGPSGIGKSECGVFLLERGGHRLVADDQVCLTRLPTDRIVGGPPPMLRHHIEVRGIGILNVRDLYGATAVRDEVEVDLVVDLEPWRSDGDYERLGVDEHTVALLGVEIPALRVPVRPGRDMAVILEIAAQNHLLKREGLHGARRFEERLAGSTSRDSEK